MPKRWSEQAIKKGFTAFFKEHHRLPTAHEIDTFPLLPSSRMLQKRYGGLPQVRTAFGYATAHFGTGPNRKRIAADGWSRSRELSDLMKEQLQRRFGEENVKTEHIFFGKYRVDFYIHTAEGAIGIDSFAASSMRTLESSVNIKMKKYQYFEQPLFLVAQNDRFTQSMLDRYSSQKLHPFPAHVELVTEATLRKRLRVLTKASR